MAGVLKQGDTGVVQRALQMAGEGRLRSVTEIQTALMREGYDQVPQYLVGLSIRRQLRALMKSSGSAYANTLKNSRSKNEEPPGLSRKG
jgi:hypothetical protein